MKKLAKILAIVLAIALIACPFVSATAVNQSTQQDGLKVEVVDETKIKVTYTSAEGFVAAMLKFTVAGVTLDDGEYDPQVVETEVLGTKDDPASAEAHITNGVMNLLITSADSASLAVYTKAVVEIPVILADEFSVTATSVQAGTSKEVGEELIAVAFADENGVIDATNPAVEATVTEADLGPVEDPALVITGASTGFGTSSLQVTFRVKKTVFDLYDSVKLVITTDKYNNTYNLADPVEYVITPAQMNTAGNYYTYIYNDIQLYELGLNFTYQLKAYDADDNYVAYSAPVTSSIAQNLKALYASNNDAALRTAIADILVVGDTATKYFAPVGSDAANATSIIAGFDTSAASASVGNLNTVDSFQSVIANFGNTSAAVNYTSKSVAIGKAPYINIRIKDSAKALDLGKLAITISYNTKDSQGSHAAQVIATGSDFNRAGNYIAYSFDQIGLLDGDEDINIVLSYDSATACTMTYSIESYLNANLTSTAAGVNATLGQITTALAKMGASVRAYLNIS